MANINNRTENAIDNAKSSARTAEANIRDAAGHVRAIGGTVQDNLRDFAYEAGQRVNDYVSAGRERAQHVAEDYADTVRERPIQTSLIALGLGVIVGIFLNRR